MGPFRFPSLRDGTVVDDCQKADFFARMHELQKRFMDGSVSPELTLEALQNTIEGKYVDTPRETKIGPFRKFGKAVDLHDNMFSCGYGAETFFADKYAEHGERFAGEEEKKLVHLFTQKNEAFIQNITLAPYRFPQIPIGEVIHEVNTHQLFPKISLGHLQIMLMKACGVYAVTDPRSVPLYKGGEGNYFPIQDINGDFWVIWVWLHNDGGWYYRFHSVTEMHDDVFNQKHGRLWLLDTPEVAVL